MLIEHIIQILHHVIADNHINIFKLKCQVPNIHVPSLMLMNMVVNVSVDKISTFINYEGN